MLICRWPSPDTPENAAVPAEDVADAYLLGRYFQTAALRYESLLRWTRCLLGPCGP